MYWKLLEFSSVLSVFVKHIITYTMSQKFALENLAKPFTF